MEEWKWSRKKSCLVFGVITSVMSLPCIFGFNIWKKIQLLGKNTNILDLEDFIVSDNLLPLGALFITIFCMSRYGWGQENFCRELSKGNGWMPGKAMLFYMRWVLPLVIIAIWLVGICKRFSWI